MNRIGNTPIFLLTEQQIFSELLQWGIASYIILYNYTSDLVKTGQTCHNCNLSMKMYECKTSQIQLKKWDIMCSCRS